MNFHTVMFVALCLSGLHQFMVTGTSLQGIKIEIQNILYNAVVDMEELYTSVRGPSEESFLNLHLTRPPHLCLSNLTSMNVSAVYVELYDLLGVYKLPLLLIQQYENKNEDKNINLMSKLQLTRATLHETLLLLRQEAGLHRSYKPVTQTTQKLNNEVEKYLETDLPSENERDVPREVLRNVVILRELKETLSDVKIILKILECIGY